MAGKQDSYTMSRCGGFRIKAVQNISVTIFLYSPITEYSQSNVPETHFIRNSVS